MPASGSCKGASRNRCETGTSGSRTGGLPSACQRGQEAFAIFLEDNGHVRFRRIELKRLPLVEAGLPGKRSSAGADIIREAFMPRSWQRMQARPLRTVLSSANLSVTMSVGANSTPLAVAVGNEVALQTVGQAENHFAAGRVQMDRIPEHVLGALARAEIEALPVRSIGAGCRSTTRLLRDTLETVMPARLATPL